MLGKEEYEVLADEVVASFVREKTPLNQSILKIAQENDFNPEQVKRLVETANVKAFLKLFNNPENKGQNIDFDVADSDHVLKDYYAPKGKSITITKVTVSMNPHEGSTPYEFESDMPDMMKHVRHGKPTMEKHTEKATEKKAEEEAPVSKKEPKMVEHLRLTKVAEQFYHNIYSEEHEYREGLETLSGEFAKLYGPDYAEFEKTALLVHGDVIKPILDEIRTNIRWDKPMFDLTKVAGKRLVVDRDTKEMTILNSMIGHKQEQAKYAEAYRVAKKKLKALAS